MILGEVTFYLIFDCCKPLKDTSDILVGVLGMKVDNEMVEGV